MTMMLTALLFKVCHYDVDGHEDDANANPIFGNDGDGADGDGSSDFASPHYSDNRERALCLS